jgi:hypothetical protein
MGSKILYVVVAVCSIFMVVGFCLAAYKLRGILKGRSIRDWPSASGTVLDAEFVTHSHPESPSYEVKVEYVYEVLGTQYRNTRIHPTYSSGSYADHRALCDKLKQAQSVRVYYNPHAPAESYIVKGSYSSNLAGFFGGVLFFFGGLLFLLIFWFGIAGKANFQDGLEITKYKTEEPTAAPTGP